MGERQMANKMQRFRAALPLAQSLLRTATSVKMARLDFCEEAVLADLIIHKAG